MLEERSNIDIIENISDSAVCELHNRIFKLNNIIIYGVKEYFTLDFTLKSNYSYVHKILNKILSGVIRIKEKEHLGDLETYPRKLSMMRSIMMKKIYFNKMTRFK